MKKAYKYKLTYKKDDSFESCSLNDATKVYTFMKKLYENIDLIETSFLLLLDCQMNLRGYTQLSTGMTECTNFEPKLIAKCIADNLAHGCILVHNHPSGGLKPSSSDDRITKNIKDIASLLDCRLLDHVIVTSESFYSYVESGNMLI